MATESTVAYGDAPEQFATLTVPDGDGPVAVVVLIHGGFWRARYGIDLMEPLVSDVVGRGFAAWSLEYRRVAQPGGGYPGTLADVAAGMDHLAVLAETRALDLERVAVVGHSAGGQLALWTGSRHLLAPGAAGAGPLVRPALVVGLAPVADLVGAAHERLGAGATQDFMGGEPAALVREYTVADPVVGATPTVLVHGDRDETVPLDQSTRYEDVAEVIAVAGDDHMAVIDPTSRSWAATAAVLERLR